MLSLLTFVMVACMFVPFALTTGKKLVCDAVDLVKSKL